MHTDDLGRHGRGQMHRFIDTDRAAIARDQLIVAANDIDDVAIEQDPAGLSERHESSLGVVSFLSRLRRGPGQPPAA